MLDVAYFNDNDEMVIDKISRSTVNLPQGYVKLNRSETVNFKVERDMTGEKFIENLERINKLRAEQKPDQLEKEEIKANSKPTPTGSATNNDNL